MFCRISVIFRVKSAKAVKITDMDLIKRLGLIVGVFILFLLIRTLVSPPVVYTGKTDSIKEKTRSRMSLDMDGTLYFDQFYLGREDLYNFDNFTPTQSIISYSEIVVRGQNP